MHEPVERPGWLERVLVLGICAGLVVALAIVDERAATREAARAQQVIGERAQRAAERSSRESMTAPSATVTARTDRLGRESPIVISSGSGLGPSAAIVAEQEVAGDAPAPQTVLHRTQGPSPSEPISAIPEPMAPLTAREPAAAPAVTAVTAATASARDDEPLLLMLMAALGLSMAGGGLRLLSRRSA